MKYKITITTIGEFTVTKNPWQKLTDDESAKPQYDYMPFETTEEKETTIFEQTTENLDLQDVILAVNGIKPKEGK